MLYIYTMIKTTDNIVQINIRNLNHNQISNICEENNFPENIKNDLIDAKSKKIKVIYFDKNNFDVIGYVDKDSDNIIISKAFLEMLKDSKDLKPVKKSKKVDVVETTNPKEFKFDQKRLDIILDKISEKGMESLTENEKNYLHLNSMN